MATAAFPNSIKTWTDKQDFVDDVAASHINEAYAEIIAMENYLKDNTSTVETLTTYSIGSFSPAVLNGQLSDLTVKGRSLKNEANYTPSTWAEWTKSVGNTADNTGLSFDAAQINTAYLPMAVKPSTKYLILLIMVSTTLNSASGGLYVKLADTVGGSIAYNSTGNQKFVVTSSANILANRISIGANLTGSGIAKISNVRVFEVPTGSDIETDVNTLTIDQLAAKYPYIKGGSVISTLSGRLTATKNAFDTNFYKKTTNVNTTINGNEIITNFTSGALFLNSAKMLTQLESNKTYTFSVIPITSNSCLALYIYDSQGTTISSKMFTNINTQSGITFTTPLNGKVALCVGGDYLNLKQCTYKLQVELGTIATDYTPYASGGQAYTQDLATKWDSFNVLTGVKTQGGNNKVLQTSDITSMYTGFTNVDIAQSSVFSDNSPWLDNVIDNKTYVEGYTEITTAGDNVSEIGKYYTVSNGKINFIFAKGTTLAQAQAALVGKTLSYQLAVPNYTYHPIGNLKAGALYTLISEPYIKDEGYYNSKVNIVAGAAKSIDWVNKIDVTNQVFTPVDITKVTLASDGLSFTITGAVTGDWYEYGAFPVDGNSTNPEVTAKASTSIGGVVNNHNDAISNLSNKTADIITVNSLINQKLSDIELLHWMGV